jgi:hypothetical protein
MIVHINVSWVMEFLIWGYKISLILSKKEEWAPNNGCILFNEILLIQKEKS